jgi:hypothetical protein
MSDEILDRLRPPGWQAGMPSPATEARERAIAIARSVLTVSGGAMLPPEQALILAQQYLRVLGLPS